MSQRFKIESDREFYCYLKAHLPPAYAICSEPSTDYYSEWHFHYVLYRDGKVIGEYQGDFRDLNNGWLIEEALRILNETRNERC